MKIWRFEFAKGQSVREIKEETKNNANEMAVPSRTNRGTARR